MGTRPQLKAGASLPSIARKSYKRVQVLGGNESEKSTVLYCAMSAASPFNANSSGGTSDRTTAYRERPNRWEHPLDPEMVDRDLGWLLSVPPFNQLDPNAFAAVGSLEQILRHDSRILRFEPGDLVVREGDYGSSAFIVLRGSVRGFLVALWDSAENSLQNAAPDSDVWARFRKYLSSFLGSMAELDSSDSEHARGIRRNWGDAFRNPIDNRDQRVVSQRPLRGKARRVPQQALKHRDGQSRIFLQDIEAIFEDYQSESLGVGSLFGELAAITRTPHRFTVVADAPTVVLEIRWQGLRLLRRDKAFSEYLDSRYRMSGLQRHLQETQLFRFLSPEAMEQVITSTTMQSFGDMEWFADFKDLSQRDVSERIEKEPLIVKEGRASDDLYLIRAGFARVSVEHGNGHQTLAYLGRGQIFGLDEIAHSFLHPTLEPVPYQNSLRALGFVDVLKIPAETCLQWVLPQVRKSELPRLPSRLRYDVHGRVPPDMNSIQLTNASDTSLVEFLVDERIMNGRDTMIIDLDRCTTCDDCVKACAVTHGGTPRFIRHGPQFGSLMFAHACMHCVDPVCMIGCPTGAIARDSDTGVIAIQPEICIGCKTCSESCPYENIVMLQAQDAQGRKLVDQTTQLPILQASKCDLCQTVAGGPACVQACPHNALFRVNTSDIGMVTNWLQKERR